jgi:CRP-like cAMP-binding protein
MDSVERARVFLELERPAVDDILALSEEVRFERREALFRQGDPVEFLFLLRAGHVKLSQLGPDGQEVVMRLAGAGDVIAAVAAFAKPERLPVGARALDDVTALLWSRPVAQEIARKHPGFAAALTREISRQAHGFQLRLLEVSTERVPQRLAQLLLRLGEQAGVPEDNGIRINVPLTRQDLAQMTGTTLFTVSRLLSEWAELGLVEIGRERVTLCSKSGLEELASPGQGDPG